MQTTKGRRRAARMSRGHSPDALAYRFDAMLSTRFRHPVLIAVGKYLLCFAALIHPIQGRGGK